MPVVDNKLKRVKIEPYNLGRFGVECGKEGHSNLTFNVNPLHEWASGCFFTVVSGVPFEKAAEIAKKLPSRRDESHTDKPDPDKDVDGKGPEDGGERTK